MQRVLFVNFILNYVINETLSYNSSFCGLPQQPPEGDDRRHAGTVEEEEGGHTLQAEAVFKVAQIERNFSLNVQDETPKQPEHRQTSLEHLQVFHHSFYFDQEWETVSSPSIYFEVFYF